MNKTQLDKTLATIKNYVDTTKAPKSHTHNSLKQFVSRPASANLTVTGDNTFSHFKSTSTMTEGKPAGDGHVVHFEWDNTGGWSSQVYVPNRSNNNMQFRGMNAGTWDDWVTLAKTTDNVASATKLQTARKIGQASFDGTANISLRNIAGSITLTSSGSGNKDKYIKFATIDCSGSTYRSCSGTLVMTSQEGEAGDGLLHFHFRTGSAITSTSITLKWVALTNAAYADRIVAVKVADGKHDLYLRPTGTYHTQTITIIDCYGQDYITLAKGSYVDSVTAAATSSLSTAYLPRSGGTLTGNLTLGENVELGSISPVTGKRQTVLKTYDGGANGNIIAIGSAGNTVIGGGESAQFVAGDGIPADGITESEYLYLTSDSSVRVVTNLQGQDWSAKKQFEFTTGGNLTVPGTVTATSFSGAAASTSAAGLMSAADKTKLNGIATNANNYSHPTSSGNKHVPSGGASGNWLKWSADGTAAWGSLPTASTSAAGIVQLSSSTSGTSETKAATEKAVKTAYDKANAALPKSGGTMTGAIKNASLPSTYVTGATGAFIVSGESAGTYQPMMAAPTTNGSMVLSVYQDRMEVDYLTKANVDAGTNTVTKSVKLATESGGGEWPGTVTANSFTENGTTLANKYAAKSHNHDSTYLKLSGGTMTGTITSNVSTGTYLLTQGSGGIKKVTDQGGLLLHCDSSLFLHSGDNAATIAADAGAAADLTNEHINLLADGQINIAVNTQVGYADSTKFTITTSGFSGNAATATKLTTASAGSATQAIYWSGGKPVAGKAFFTSTAVGDIGWTVADNNSPVTVSGIAYWNGAYKDTSSNLAYCNQGAFGSMATKSSSDYLAKSGGTMSGNITFNNNIGLIGKTPAAYTNSSTSAAVAAGTSVKLFHYNGAGNLHIGDGLYSNYLNTGNVYLSSPNDIVLRTANGKSLYFKHGDSTKMTLNSSGDMSLVGNIYLNVNNKGIAMKDAAGNTVWPLYVDGSSNTMVGTTALVTKLCGNPISVASKFQMNGYVLYLQTTADNPRMGVTTDANTGLNDVYIANTENNWFRLRSDKTITYAGSKVAIDGQTISRLTTSNWWYSTGKTGWYNETYDGGWYMTDTSWVRSYADKGVYTGGKFKTTNEMLVEKSAGDTYFTASRTDVGVSCKFGVGSGGSNHGVYSPVFSAWLVYGDKNNKCVKYAMQNGGTAGLDKQGHYAFRYGSELSGASGYITFSW